MADNGTAAQAATEQMMSFLKDWQGAGMGAMAWSNPVWLRQMTAMNAEVTRFVTERIQQDLKLQADLLQCRDPAEFREIQGQFLKQAFEQYSAETGKLAEMNRVALDAATGGDAGD